VVSRTSRRASRTGQCRARPLLRAADTASGVFSGWLGVYLDTAGQHTVDWQEIAAVLEDAYRHVAPESLVADLNDRSF
jgi:hypothetical protein